ncbi:MAG: MgtE intracellular region [Synergistaceae bacterium]|jgi:flagellar motility protein MotE (MotC chaperone)|nr:MgtE intracellular region [Synergistaceae bacterium]
MADFQNIDPLDEESATPDSRTSPDTGRVTRKKKKKKRGCGFFILTLLLIAGAAAGLQASGSVDLRPVVYPLVPKLPRIGPDLAKLLGIPDVYSLTVDERRRIELDEWEQSLAVEARSLDEYGRNLEILSSDLSIRESDLTAAREEIASRLEALSNDMDSGRGPEVTEAQRAEIEETVRTFQDMSPRNAAAIMERLSDNLAVAILDGLPQDIRGNLLGRMNPDAAARLTEQLTEFQRNKKK